MKRIYLMMSCLAIMVAMTGCKSKADQERVAMIEPLKQEVAMLKDAIRHRSPDVQRVEIIGNTVVYTHIFDGIVDVKTYFYDGDVCLEAERVYTFPTQVAALRHYRNAVEKAELYDNIAFVDNQVKYDLKKDQVALECDGLTKEQLKAKFDKQIDKAEADLKKHKDKKSEKCCKEKK